MDDWSYQTDPDLNLPPLASMRSLKREAGLVSWMLHGFWGRCTSGYMRLAHRLDIQGREHLPTEAPFVLVANHNSHLDTFALQAAVRPRLRAQIYPIAAGDHFFRGWRSSVFSAVVMNALPMWRGKAVRHALAEMREKLMSTGAIFILYPEGTRSRSGELGQFKAGIGMLVADTAIPVVPAWIEGAGEAWPHNRRLPRPGKMSIRFGPPLSFADTPNRRAGWDEISAALAEAVQAARNASTA